MASNGWQGKKEWKMEIQKLEYLENEKKHFRWDQNHFSQFFKDYHLVKKKKQLIQTLTYGKDQRAEFNGSIRQWYRNCQRSFIWQCKHDIFIKNK